MTRTPAAGLPPARTVPSIRRGSSRLKLTPEMGAQCSDSHWASGSAPACSATTNQVPSGRGPDPETAVLCGHGAHEDRRGLVKRRDGCGPGVLAFAKDITPEHDAGGGLDLHERATGVDIRHETDESRSEGVEGVPAGREALERE